MGITERRQREREQRRSDIVDAAERVFFSRGWAQATMDEVAAEAELAKATLYLYFESKEALYAAVQLRGMEIMYAMFDRASRSHQRGIDRVEAIGRAYVEFARTQPDHFGAMLHFESKEPGPALSECEQECHNVGQKTIELVADAVRAGIEDGTIRADIDPLRTAFILWAQSTGMVQITSVKGAHIRDIHGVSTDDLMERFFEFVGLALRPD